MCEDQLIICQTQDSVLGGKYDGEGEDADVANGRPTSLTLQINFLPRLFQSQDRFPEHLCGFPGK